MKTSPMSRRRLSLAVAGALMTSWHAVAAPIVADGVHVDVSDIAVESNPIDWSHGLSAVKGGTITANNVVATGTGANYSHGVHAEGAGSHLDVTGGIASASGANSYGVAVRSGGSVAITGTAVQSSGNLGAGARAIGAGSAVTFSNVDVSTTGYGSHAMLAMDGATMGGSGARLDSTGNFSDGVHVLHGSQFRGSQLEIHTTGQQSRGVATGDAGSLLSITDSTILTEGPHAHGARARGGAVLEIIDTQVTTRGLASKGVEFEGGIGIVKGSSFDSTGHALDVWAAGQADVLDSSFTTALDGAYGMRVIQDGTLTVGISRITTGGREALGVTASTGGHAALVATTIDTHGDLAHGISATAGGTAIARNVLIYTNGGTAYGIHADGVGSEVNVVGGRVATTGEAARAVQAEGGAHIRLDGLSLQTGSTTGGKDSDGIRVRTAGTVELANSTIFTLGERSRGLHADGAGGAISGADVMIDTAGYQSYGVLAQSGSSVDLQGLRIQTRGEDGHGIVAVSGATVAANEAFVQTSGSSAYALSADSGGSIAIERGVILSLGDGSLAVLSAANAGETTSVSLNNADVYAAQATVFQVRGDGINEIALRGSRADSGNGDLLRDALDGRGTINFSAAASELYGDVVFSDGYTSNIALSEGALLRGAAQYVDDLQLAESRWDMTGDSLVGTLTARNSTIAFNHDDGIFKTLTVTGDYIGDNALLQMNTVLGDDSSGSDRLHVLGSTAGDTGIAVNNIGGPGALTREGIQLVQVDGASTGSFTLVGRAVGGAYEYFLHKGGVTDPANGDWYLRSELPADPGIEPPVDPGIDPPVDPGIDPGVDPEADPDPCSGLACVDPERPSPSLIHRPETGAYLANQAAAVGMFDHSMHQRLGEPNLAERLRNDNLLGSAWLRTTANHTRFNAADGQLDVGTHHSMLQVGTDLAKWGQDSRGLAGVMVATGKSTTQSTSNLTGYGAKGTVNGTALGLYATWFQSPAEQTGAYVDAWVQASRFKNTMQGDALARERYDSRALTASVEAGYAFKVREGANSALYVEPQAQVTWTDFSMDTHLEGNGTQVRSVDAGGLQSRLGVRAYGHDTAAGGNRVQPFVGVNWIRARGEGNSLALNETYVAGGQPRDTYEAKAGAQLQLGGGWTGWGELSTTRGKGDYTNYGAQLGVKHSW
ncbi:autotransporter outer membrane beta-barrel domain-containing protein [Stenotrophomonas sp. PS02301]|uniref:autotransporter outer membrane beta-barrel domain-containing protein n=1 Tax=Stenotrophomonas sp. PS02301 TaxID=2991427 RepID=UPI00249C7727|nr:autotransporter outer membrane beta-barrel domain-containing protein [Stenotrophomonas sp. PS02301]